MMLGAHTKNYLKTKFLCFKNLQNNKDSKSNQIHATNINMSTASKVLNDFI